MADDYALGMLFISLMPSSLGTGHLYIWQQLHKADGGAVAYEGVNIYKDGFKNPAALIKNFVQVHLYNPKMGLKEERLVEDQIKTLAQLSQEMPDIIMLKDGYFLERYPGRNAIICYALKRLMEDDDILGTLDIVIRASSSPANNVFMWRLKNAASRTIASEAIYTDEGGFKNPVARTKNFVQVHLYKPEMGLTEA